MMVWLVYEKQPALCFPNVQAAFYTFKRPIRLPKNLSLQIKQYLLVLCRSGEIGNGVRAFG